MSKKKRKSKTREGGQKPSYLLPNEIIDELIEPFHGKDPDSLLGTDDLAGQLKKQLAERILVAELSHPPKAESAKASPGKSAHHRNGSSPKTVLTPESELKPAIPRDRHSSVDPQLVARHQRQLPNVATTSACMQKA